MSRLGITTRSRSHEHRHPEARAGPAPQLARSSETTSVRRRSSDPIAWAERIAGLALDPWQREVLLSAAPRLLLNATRQSGKSTVAALKAAWTVLQGALPWWSRRRCASPASCSASSPVTLSPRTPASGETMTEVELVSGGLAVSLPGDRPAMLRGLSLRDDGPAVLIVDEASRVRDELWATISPMLAAAPAAQQILLSTPAGAGGEFHRAWSSGEDWERVQITADQCPRISAEHLAAERIRLGDALYRRSISALSSQRPAASSTPRCWHTCLAMTLRMSPRSRVHCGRTDVDRFLQ